MTNSTTGKNTISFMGLSGFLHASVVAAVVTMNLAQSPKMQEVIEFEVATPLGSQLENPLSDLPKASKNTLPNAEAAELPQLETSTAAEDVVVATPPPPPKKATKKIAKQLPAKKAVPKVMETLPEPAFETALESDVSVAANELDESFLNDDLDKIDQEQEQKFSRLESEIGAETESFLENSSELAEELKQQAAQDAERLKQAAEAQKRLDAEAIAKAQAQEAALLAEATQKARADEAGTGSTKNKVAFGSAEGVRSLDQLKQRPGNKRPQYDYDDRLHRRQGEVSFLAYISHEGAPVKFKMIQSSGHRTLDFKTLAAIKNWKFFPGQEGWVEIPFKWDLKGGPKELPARLRTKVSQF